MTLKILKNQQNKVVLTLSELAIESLPNNWLLVFTRDQTNETVDSIYVSDLSDHPNRYNEFLITEGEGEDIEFPASGFYTYRAYQMPNGGSTDVSTGHIVEIGKVLVIDESEEDLPAYQATIVNKVYEH